jgi:hypothetical protein
VKAKGLGLQIESGQKTTLIAEVIAFSRIFKVKVFRGTCIIDASWHLCGTSTSPCLRGCVLNTSVISLKILWVRKGAG